tara:strand:+ start:1728 stop:2870 length:1143 start_codon:yes stop_codon:yes gene_type:complete
MSSTAELKKIKLNVTNIRSVLLDGKKAVDEKKKDREDFLQKLAEEKKQKQEEKGLEKPIKPTQKKPDLKSPVKSSMGLMDRIFNFVGAIVGGIIVKALPEIIDAVKKIMKQVKPIFEKIVEGLKPVFNFIGDLFKDKGTYDSEKEKVDGDIEQAQLAGKDIDAQGGELNKASDEIVNENKGLNANANALGGEEDGLKKDREEKKEEKDEDNDNSTNDDSTDVESNENITVENLGPTSASVVTKMVDGKEVVVTDMDESLKLQNEARNMLKNATSGDGEVVSSTEITSVTNVIVPPVMPVKENFPRTRQGRRNFRNAYKQYVIEMKEYNKTQQNLVKPSESNKNGLSALNTTGGLTSANGSGSTTVVYQRQVVEVAVPVQV